MSMMFAAISYAFLFLCSTIFDFAAAEVSRNESIPPAIFVFGDSYLDSGNNNVLNTEIKSNFPPYGRDFLGGIPTGRFSNGKLISDLIAEGFGIEQFVPAYLDPKLQFKDFSKGANFASGGTGLDPLTSAETSALPLIHELKLFIDYSIKLRKTIGEKETDYILKNSVYLVSFGSNDIGFTYFNVGLRRNQYDVPSYVGLLIDLAAEFLKDLYALGARRIGVLGTSVVGCIPFSRTLAGGIMRECAKPINDASVLFNSKLSKEIDFLNAYLNESRMVFLDFYGPLLNMIQNPGKYGFDVVGRGCCGTGTVETAVLCNEFIPPCKDASKYVFWDALHPTERVNKLVTPGFITKIKSSF